MQSQHETWTITRLLQWSTQYLQQKGIAEARLNAERLLAHVLQLSRVDLYLQFDRPLTKPELTAFKKLLLRRAAHEPLQYILQETDFFSLSFKIRQGVLIPRPETEILVEKAIGLASALRDDIRILDAGTGSGIIAITLAFHLPRAQVVAVDISPAALNLARENAARHGVEDKIEFVNMDLLRATTEDRFRRSFELIVSNPPYISRDEEELLPPEVRQFEPPEALFAEDPMAFYRALARLSRLWLVPGGWLLCELAPHRAGQVKSIFENAGLINLELFPDLAAKLRGIKARTPIKKEENRDQSKHLSRV